MMKSSLSQKTDIVCNENGYVTLVTVLGALLLLTVVSLSMISTSINDQQIVRNDKLTKRAFYLAEFGANEAAQLVENAATTDTDPTASLAWVQQTNRDYFESREYWRDPSNNYAWYTANSTVPPITLASIPSVSLFGAGAAVNAAQPNSNLEILDDNYLHNDDVHIASNFEGVAAGSSLKVTSTTGRLYAYHMFGMFSSQTNRMGESLIEEGYRKRF